MIDGRAAERHAEYSGDRRGLTCYERDAAARQAVGVELAAISPSSPLARGS